MADESQAWLERALADGFAGAWRWQVESNSVTWTPSAFDLFRVSSFDGTFDAFLELVHPLDRQKVNHTVASSLKERSTYSCQFRLADHPAVWLEARGRASYDGKGHPVEMLGAIHDISARKAAEENLVQIAAGVSSAQGDGFLRSLVENLAVVLDADVTYVGTKVEAGLSVKSVALWADGEIGDNVEYAIDGTPCAGVVAGQLCLYPNDVRSEFPDDVMLQELGIVGYAGIPISVEQEDFGLVVVLWRRPIPNPQLAESALRIFGARAGAELERQAAEAQLRRSAAALGRQKDVLSELSRSPLWRTAKRDALMRQLTQIAAETLDVERVGIWLFNADRSKLVLQDQYLKSRRSHSHGGELDRLSFLPYFEALERDRVIAAHNAAQDPRTCCFVDAYLAPHGIGAMLDAPIRVAAENAGVICCEHVGEPRRWTPEEESFSGSLADFAGLALELAERRSLEEQLLQSQRLESIGRLAGGVAHDFNNLLTAIGGGAELARMAIAGGESADPFLDDILEATQRAAGLTSQLLGFARRRVIEPRVIDLNDIVGKADRMLRRLIGEDITLETRLAESLWTIRADPGQLEQILVNLAVNARDAMPGGGQLLLETRNVTLSPSEARRHPNIAGGDYVQLAVADTGEGIEQAVLPHVFEPFFTTKAGHGTGLGLATCYGIVLQAGGQIFVHSAIGQGTVFNILLPRAETSSKDSLDIPTFERRSHGGETLLLVEDDPRVRRMAEAGLEEFGYRVLSAADPLEALALAARHSDEITLLITDVVMPNMSGQQLVAELAKKGSEIEVLYVSGYTPEGLTNEGASETETHFLAKPFTPTALANKVSEILEAR